MPHFGHGAASVTLVELGLWSLWTPDFFALHSSSNNLPTKLVRVLFGWCWEIVGTNPGIIFFKKSKFNNIENIKLSRGFTLLCYIPTNILGDITFKHTSSNCCATYWDNRMQGVVWSNIFVWFKLFSFIHLYNQSPNFMTLGHEGLGSNLHIVD